MPCKERGLILHMYAPVGLTMTDGHGRNVEFLVLGVGMEERTKKNAESRNTERGGLLRGFWSGRYCSTGEAETRTGARDRGS